MTTKGSKPTTTMTLSDVDTTARGQTTTVGGDDSAPAKRRTTTAARSLALVVLLLSLGALSSSSSSSFVGTVSADSGRGGGFAAAAKTTQQQQQQKSASVALSAASTATASPPSTSSSGGGAAASTAAARSAESFADAAAAVVSSDTGSSTGEKKKDPNVVVQLASYVKNSVTTTIEGCGQLWTNHGRCNAIRKKINVYRDELKQKWEEDRDDDLTSEQKKLLKTKMGGISFDEYSFLQKGKEDRGKVMNLMFLMWGAPKFLPYALLFNPEMLPSPFVRGGSGGDEAAPAGAGSAESVWAKQSRQRSIAIIEALIRLEKDARDTPVLAKINVFGKKQQEERKSQLASIIARTGEFMKRAGNDAVKDASEMLSQLDLFRTGSDFDRAERRLVGVPKTIVRGVADALSPSGLFANLQPHFMTRGKIVGHIQKVAECDDFLVSTQVNLTTVNKRLLQETCSDRFIMSAGSANADELRRSLSDWLDLAVRRPQAHMKQLQEQQASGIGPDDGDETTIYYNDNLGRMALMAYYGLRSTRDGRSSLQLPRLLYAGRSEPSSSSAVSSRGQRGFWRNRLSSAKP